MRIYELTFDAGFPHIVLVLEARYNIVADLERKHKIILASLFEYKPRGFRVSILGDGKNDIIPTSSFNGEAQDFHFWIKCFCNAESEEECV